jgi:hypothetical protein
MDIKIYNTYNYLKFFIGNDVKFSDVKNTYEYRKLTSLLNLIQSHKFKDPTLYNQIHNNIDDDDVMSINDYIIPQLIDEFKSIDTGVIKNMVDYMNVKSILTDYILNYKIDTNKYPNSPYEKIGEYIENKFDEFIKDNINEDLKNNKNSKIKKYEPKIMKKGGLVVRNILKSIDHLMGYFQNQDYYKFSKKLLNDRDKLIKSLSDYDTTIIFGSITNQKYLNFNNNEIELNESIDKTLESIRDTILNDIHKTGNNSINKNIIEFIIHNIPIQNLFLKNIISSNDFSKIPNSLNTDIYTYNEKSKQMSKVKVNYSDKNNILFNYNADDRRYFFDMKNDTNKYNLPKLPLEFKYSYVNDIDNNTKFKLLRIAGSMNLIDSTTKMSVTSTDTVDPNTNKHYINYNIYNFELLDISVDINSETVIKECNFEKNNNTISLGFNSILYDNVKMFIHVPNKPEKRCKRLSILISMYNLIYTLNKLNKLNYELIIDWYDRYNVEEKTNFFNHVITICFSQQLNSNTSFISKLSLHKLALIYDKLSFNYDRDINPTLSPNIRKTMSIYFEKWRHDHIIKFNKFLINYYPKYYEKLYYIGGARFNLDRHKFKDYYDENIDNKIKKLNINTVDIDCHFYLDNKNEQDFYDRIEDFYKGFKFFINSSVDNEFIKILFGLIINEKNNSWKAAKNVQNNILYKYEYIINDKFTEYYPTIPIKEDIHPVYSTVNDNYYIINADKTINYNESRPYFLLRESIVLKNKTCNHIKNANLLELNIISKSRLFNMYNYFYNYNSYNLLNRLNIPFNNIVVFLQKICYDNKEKDEMKNMLYSTWINYKFNIKPKNNLYRFVHYAKYYSEGNLYNEYINDFNEKLKKYLTLKNISIYNILKMPKEKLINTFIDTCNNYTETILLSESEPEFKCKQNNINFDTMDFEYDIEYEYKQYEDEKKDEDEDEDYDDYEDEKIMDIFDEEDIVENINRIKIYDENVNIKKRKLFDGNNVDIKKRFKR